ncbi:type II toxin-antitoxin system Phd/YefM family antitoxin [Aliidiomarina haloalkalitolerans]|uniref:Type II toxin-antitoxin system Phd/YefM family antitoxin n=1 Tax=Aliidiomarina haloalkalitolerans TaxID=859059 RepID=A0A432VSZ8_9GAMM|nr:type II toxin-antitoxin system Phd/YefM family antitoxin [Aliidiomarina haloalkalitolerans]RUO19532.1 type II toxin-antitoxin system Phd/YefM family antitoxin [Aliidiomarina haloalkalitolerans]
MQIKTISYIKQHAANLDVEEPIVVTQGGTPVYRIESEQAAQLRDEGIALLKLMNIAERDVRSGRMLSEAELLADLGYDNKTYKP